MIPSSTRLCPRKPIHLAVLSLTFMAVSLPSWAQTIHSYGEAITTALSSNPAVTRAYYEFEADREAEKVARGELLPSVDLSGDYSWQERQTPIADFGDYEADSLRFSITQLLFDGFQARDEMRARRYEKLARYYEFHAASQATALDATEAYLDTLRFQELVRYAEENYVVHRQIYNKIAERAAGGVSQRVDLEQATARMALAESNLLTEVTNLHDTRVEFQRVVGLLPADTLPLPELPEEVLPASREDALLAAYSSSPEVNAAIEEMRSAREEHNATRGPMMPRVDLRYRNEQETNTDGILGDYDLQAVEVVMSYNLYRGGADSARRREFANRYYAAVEARKEVCLTVRRETVIAFNDVDVLRRQVSYLEQQLEAQDRTRRAYIDQFDIGQRSLLDLLDSQNEYFDTQRALIRARTQLTASQARTLAQVGVLVQALDAQGFNEAKISELRLKLERREREEIPACPEGVPGAINIDQEAIFQRLNEAARGTDSVFQRRPVSAAPARPGREIDVSSLGSLGAARR
ncbi:MAG: TolC family outer membrane protein [Halieaceae bacterium]|nr:TolC family outer membrane protein [Halieaceae bacterium]